MDPNPRLLAEPANWELATCLACVLRLASCDSFRSGALWPLWTNASTVRWGSTQGENMVRLWTRYQGRFAHDELGVTITQYALIAAFIAVVAMAAAVFLGSEISGRFNEVSDTAQSA